MEFFKTLPPETRAKAWRLKMEDLAQSWVDSYCDDRGSELHSYVEEELLNYLDNAGGGNFMIMARAYYGHTKPADGFEPYNNSTHPLPEALVGHSPMMVNTLKELGWEEDTIKILLDLADSNNDHPDWSEASADEIGDHFGLLYLNWLMEQARESEVGKS